MDLKIFLNLLMDLTFRARRSQDSKMITLFLSAVSVMMPFTKIRFGAGSGSRGRSCSRLDI